MIKVVTTKSNLETERIQHQNANFCKDNNIELLVIDEDNPEIEVDKCISLIKREKQSKLYKYLS